MSADSCSRRAASFVPALVERMLWYISSARTTLLLPFSATASSSLVLLFCFSINNADYAAERPTNNKYLRVLIQTAIAFRATANGLSLCSLAHIFGDYCIN